MPPALALFACIIAVAMLLAVDAKASQGLSLGLWVPTLWFLYSASRPVSDWLNGRLIIDEELTVESGNPLERAVLTSLIVLGLLILLRRRIEWRRIFADNQALLILFVIMLISILWSDYPIVSIKRWVRNVGTVVMALVVLTDSYPFEALSALLRRCAYILIPFSVVLVKYYPQLGMAFNRWNGAEMWIGVTPQKNSLGILCAVCAFFLIWMLAGRWKKVEPTVNRLQNYYDLGILVLICWLLKGPGGSYSATSLVSLALGLACCIGVANGRIKIGWPSRLLVLSIFIVGFATPLLSFWSGKTPISLVAGLVGRSETLTGRTDEIWSTLVPISLQAPWFGRGFGSFWVTPILPVAKLSINEAHNGYLDLFIELGIVGLLSLATLVFAFVRKCRQQLAFSRRWAAFGFGFLIMFVAHNTTESSFLGSTALLWNIFVVLLLVFSAEETSPVNVLDVERFEDHLPIDGETQQPVGRYGSIF